VFWLILIARHTLHFFAKYYHFLQKNILAVQKWAAFFMRSNRLAGVQHAGATPAERVT